MVGLALVSSAWLAPALRAADPFQVAAETTVLVLVSTGASLLPITGTLIAQSDGSASVFAVFPYGLPGDTTQYDPETYRVAFRRGDKLQLRPAQRVAWDPKGGWLVLRLRGKDLPTPPELSPDPLSKPGGAYVLGCYAPSSIEENALPSPNIQKCSVSSIIQDETGGDRIPVVNRELVPNSAGGPVLDGAGRLVAFTGSRVAGTSTSRTIPLESVWTFITKSPPILQFSYAQPTPDGWRVPCRIWSALPVALQGEPRVGIGLRTEFDPPSKQATGTADKAKIFWQRAQSDHAFMLPVMPPERQLRHYVVIPAMAFPKHRAVKYPPVNLVVNYQAPPATEPWLRPVEAKP
jgi:hypothetical protein